MGYSADGSIAELFPEDFIDRVAREAVTEAGKDLEEHVTRRTPIADLPAAYAGKVQPWIIDRRGRLPGTARRSWFRTPITVADGVYSISVDTDDDKMVYIEHDTAPHVIRPRILWRVVPDGKGGTKQVRAMLRFPGRDGRFHFAPEVHHPGTAGVHMMRDSLGELEIRWEGYAIRALERQAALR
jgi:hypothetical protein